jgi:hypothetical protein
MLEIKCPVSRKLVKSDDHKDACPIYYYDQVLQQLEVCDLDECDFWQCKVEEYNSREEFLNDTDKNEPFRSKKTELEKGCLIQLFPRNIKLEKDDDKNAEITWIYSKFIHPPRINMTPYECDKWVVDTISKVNSDPDYEFYGYVIDKVIYWRIQDTHCITIKRDKKWFAQKLPTYLKTWEMVEFFRKNQDAKELLKNYLLSIGYDFTKEDRDFNTKYFGDKINQKMIDLMNLKGKQKDSHEYNSIVNSIKNEIEINKKHLKDGTLKDKFKADKYPNRKFYKKKVSPTSSEGSSSGDAEFEIIDME